MHINSLNAKVDIIVAEQVNGFYMMVTLMFNELNT